MAAVLTAHLLCAGTCVATSFHGAFDTAPQDAPCHKHQNDSAPSPGKSQPPSLCAQAPAIESKSSVKAKAPALELVFIVETGLKSFASPALPYAPAPAPGFLVKFVRSAAPNLRI